MNLEPQNFLANAEVYLSQSKPSQGVLELILALLDQPDHADLSKVTDNLIQKLNPTLNPNEFLHQLRDHVQRLPLPKWSLWEKTHEVIYQKPVCEPQILEQLKNTGMIHLKNALTPQELSQIQSDFENTMLRIRESQEIADESKHGFQKEYYHPRMNFFVSNIPFENSPHIMKLMSDSRLTSIINSYLGDWAQINQAVASRIPPDSPDLRDGSFQWHHDAWGRRINVMVLLTDNDKENDQYMTYLLGSHNLYHSLELFKNSRISQEQYKNDYAQFPIFKAQGNAGDIFIFDSNGIHSGNRGWGRQRDVYITHFTRDDSYVFGLNLPQEYHDLSPEEKRIWSRALSKKGQHFPKSYNWVKGLEDVSSWLPYHLGLK